MRTGRVITALPDEYNVQIGAIIAKWATLEYQMMTIIWRAMGMDNVEGRVLTVGMGTQVLCGVLRNLPKKWITDELIKQELAKLVKAVNEYVDARNNIAHGIWTKYEDDPLPYLNFMKQSNHRIMPASQAISPTQLRAFSKTLDVLNQMAAGVVLGLGSGDGAPPLPDTRGEQNPAGLPTQTQTEQ